MRHKLFLTVPVLACMAAGSLALTACGPKFGDSCKNSTDCSVRGGRICDESQPGGYCTLPNCKPGDCGDDGLCVRFRPEEPRLSTSYCMGKCDSNRDCDRDDYVCRSDDQINEHSMAYGGDLAEVLEGQGKGKFCILKEQ